ncbi:chromosome segregation protein ParM [Pseudomonas helleri]|uniref:Chromosome segregation protein ParM n=1 Tax=Pseudomonas helleri TaxID=1608996 RepID=A0A7X1Y356_9PSED|nr:chromosome segregation protein ParM [Pseudomonas helleri]
MFVTKQRDDREKRLRAVNYARASAGLEGFKLSAEDEENARAFVESEITLGEFIEYSSTH